MAEENVQDSQELDEEQSQVDTAAKDEKDTEQDSETFDKEYVKSLRDESAKWRKQFRELEKTVKAQNESGLSENEKLQKELKELRKEKEELSNQMRDAKITAAAAKLNAKYPSALSKLIPPETDLDELDNAIKDLKKEYPDLFRTINVDAGASGETSPVTDMNALIRRGAKK